MNEMPFLNSQQQQLLVNCLIDFRCLISLPSEYAALKRLYDKVTNIQELTDRDIFTVLGIISTILDTYTANLHACDKNPGKYPDEVRRHYIEKVVSITDLLKYLKTGEHK